MGAFGDKLRKQREQRGISLDAISTTTKISPRMLRAIEDEHFDQLPGGVFNKGFVRAYARQVGLDEEEAISDYLAALRESQVQSQPTLPNFRHGTGNSAAATENSEPPDHDPKINVAGNGTHSQDRASLSGSHPQKGLADSTSDRRLRTDDRRKQPRRSQDRETASTEVRAHTDLRIEQRDDVAPSSTLSFLNLGSDAASHYSAEDHPGQVAASESNRAHHPSSRVPWGKLAAALLLVTLALALWSLRRRHQANAAAQSPAASQPALAPHEISSPAVVASPLASTLPSKVALSPPVKHSSTATTPATRPTATPPDPDTNPPVAKSHTPAPTANPPLKFTLVIRADQTSWVSINADGQSVAQETLIAPAHTSVRASSEVIVKVGNAAGVSFLLNGKEISVHGNPGEVRSFTFDANGMRDSATP